MDKNVMATANLVDFINDAINTSKEMEISMMSGKAAIHFSSTISDIDVGKTQIIIYAQGIMIDVPTDNIGFNEELEEFYCCTPGGVITISEME